MIDRLYYIRHGQTDWNKDKKIMGRADIPLNDEGRRQAQEAREKLKGITFSVILISPLSRALETGQIIAEAHPETPFVAIDALAERDFGDYEGVVNDGNYFGQWNYEVTSTPNGETPKELYARIKNFLDLVKDTHQGNVLIVTHGGVGLMVEAYFAGVPADGQMLQYVTGNGEVKVYDIEYERDV